MMDTTAMVKVSPSILSADFANLGKDVLEISSMGADYLHVDVMDGSFVPNITIGPGVIKSIRHLTKVPFLTHLMIDHPERIVDNFAAVGSDYITVHVEAKGDVREAIRKIRDSGKLPGIALNPPTPFKNIQELVPLVDLVLVMTVNPGFGGQALIPQCLTKVSRLRELRERLGASFLIEVDGGINASTAPLAVRAGAEVLVAGSAVFYADDPAEVVRSLLEAQ